MKLDFSKAFLSIGNTQTSKEAGEGGFKRFVGVGSTFVRGVQPTKKEIDEFFGFESQAEPEYVKDTDNGKEVHITFLLQVDSSVHKDVDLKARAMFTLRQAPAYNRDQTKVQVIDAYGNTTWANTEDAKAGKKILTDEGKEKLLDSKYRMACVGEADLVHFLKTYLRVPSSFEYKNGAWVKKSNANDGLFGLEHIKDYFNGDFSELKEALKMQPNNKVKLLYGVRTADTENGTRQYQAVASRADFILSNNAGSAAIQKMEKRLADAKNNGSFPTTEYKVQDLQEYAVEPTNLDKPMEDASSDMPWD